jgi:hypothetical protein
MEPFFIPPATIPVFEKVSAIFTQDPLAPLHDPLARENHLYLQGTVARKAEVERLLNTSLLFPGVNKKSMREIAFGEYTDLNKITAASQSIDGNHNSVSFENGSLAVTSTTKAVPIRTFVDLYYALGLWVSATLLIYPHRKYELSTYVSSLLEMVRLQNASITRVIEYDVLIRQRVALDKSLTHISDFGFLRQAHFAPPASFVFDTPAKASTPSAKKPRTVAETPAVRAEQICDKFNRGKCLDTPCVHGRQHILKCASCNKTGHATKDCPPKQA